MAHYTHYSIEFFLNIFGMPFHYVVVYFIIVVYIVHRAYMMCNFPIKLWTRLYLLSGPTLQCL